jgi:hypothetical protein
MTASRALQWVLGVSILTVLAYHKILGTKKIYATVQNILFHQTNIAILEHVTYSYLG